MNKTLDYYNRNAKEYTSNTLDVRFTEMEDIFLSYLPQNSWILDFGCGSGRDTKYFLLKGFHVEAIDGSRQMCEIASKNTGIKIKQMKFEELSEEKKYNGIWACASILHVEKARLKMVFQKMRFALKDNGIIYTCFKYGNFEGERNGRYFTDFTEESFQEFLKDEAKFQVKRIWKTQDVRKEMEDVTWLNIILSKIS